MGDRSWPVDIKPLTNKNYSTSRGANVFSSNVAGGLPRIGLDHTIEAVPFKLNFSLTEFQYQIVIMFYDAVINHGANSFKMMLDSGNGIEEHQAYITPGTWQATKPAGNLWYLAFDVIAETTSSQLETCTNLFDLYECYGDDLPQVLNLLSEVVDNFPRPRDV